MLEVGQLPQLRGQGDEPLVADVIAVEAQLLQCCDCANELYCLTCLALFLWFVQWFVFALLRSRGLKFSVQRPLASYEDPSI